MFLSEHIYLSNHHFQMLTLGGGSQGQATVNRKRLLSGWLFVLGTTLLNGALDLMIVIVYHGYVRQQFGKDSQQDEEYFQLLWFEGEIFVLIALNICGQDSGFPQSWKVRESHGKICGHGKSGKSQGK